jgi:hypothetical protein
MCAAPAAGGEREPGSAPPRSDGSERGRTARHAAARGHAQPRLPHRALPRAAHAHAAQGTSSIQGKPFFAHSPKINNTIGAGSTF